MHPNEVGLSSDSGEKRQHFELSIGDELRVPRFIDTHLGTVPLTHPASRYFEELLICSNLNQNSQFSLPIFFLSSLFVPQQNFLFRCLRVVNISAQDVS